MKVRAKGCRLVVRGIRPQERTISGWRVGDWAAHEQIDTPGLFGLTLLPIGLSLPFVWASFRRLSDAVRAAHEIGRVRNDWHRVGQGDFTGRLRDQLMGIVARHGAVDGDVQVAWDADVGLLGAPLDGRLNGYEAAPWPA